jgi:hypothetical protein
MNSSAAFPPVNWSLQFPLEDKISFALPPIRVLLQTPLELIFALAATPILIPPLLASSFDASVVVIVWLERVSKYGTQLDKDDTLQNHFIEAWESIDNEPHDLSFDRYKISEVRRLISKPQFSKQINLFSLAHNGFLSFSHYQTNPHELTQLLRLILRTL